MLKTIIIDDELHSRQALRTYLERYCAADIQIVAEGDGIQSGLEQIKAHQPDLLFLDIEMPFGNAFDLIERLPRHLDAELVFVTAYEQYAIRALNLSAAHYLLKPVDIDELIEAVAKVKAHSGQKQQRQVTQTLLENLSTPQAAVPSRLALPTLQGLEIIVPEEVRYCLAEDNFTEFHLNDGKKLLICRPLKFYANLLEPAGFCRIHRSTLVNLQYVRRYQRGKGGSVFLVDGTELLVSASRKAALLAGLSE
ncbi:MAG: LytTR family DNA-binding domain-containing protein [Bacteroidota bacterium]